MPARDKLNELAERKRALVLQADQYREAVGAERRHITETCAAIRDQTAAYGWWFGAAAAAGWLLPGSIGKLLRQLPAMFAAAQKNPAPAAEEQH